MLTSSKNKANLFARNISSHSTLDNTLHSLPDFSLQTEKVIFYENHCDNGCKCNLCELDVAKATGLDCISSVVLRMCSPELSPVLAKLRNKCLFESCLPFCLNFDHGHKVCNTFLLLKKKIKSQLFLIILYRITMRVVNLWYCGIFIFRHYIEIVNKTVATGQLRYYHKNAT